MHYLKLTDEIRDLIGLLPEVKNKKINLGCKPYCKSQIIANDELELLKKLLKESKIKDLSTEEFRNLKQSTKTAYYVNYHTCQADESNKVQREAEKLQSEEERNRILQEELEKELLKDKVPEKEVPHMFSAKLDYEYLGKLQKEINDEASGKNSFSVKESNLSYGMSTLGSFFLIVIGAYYFCDIILQLNKENTYKITMVITIIVLLAEAILLMIRLDKDNNKVIQGKGLNKKSFAYKFNSEYREKVDKELEKRKKGKVYNKEKSD
jgi:hypothetical protein